ncbi:carboxymuconolactone decarboxylase family protein [Limosilactobacillus panis]|uniref:carboxymuconolactone decarboxylase family protein n=1 Tax=Limosilactobacillus panis TaxID=47493 RepID=UPI001F463F37|nr:carboxymuconolactone decarboxylase family protein [Limosilactobacillus panis]
MVQHVQGAIKLGATRDEIVETINVAIMMGGGPSTVYGGKALACADQLLKDK